MVSMTLPRENAEGSWHGTRALRGLSDFLCVNAG